MKATPTLHHCTLAGQLFSSLSKRTGISTPGTAKNGVFLTFSDAKLTWPDDFEHRNYMYIRVIRQVTAHLAGKRTFAPGRPERNAAKFKDINFCKPLKRMDEHPGNPSTATKFFLLLRPDLLLPSEKTMLQRLKRFFINNRLWLIVILIPLIAIIVDVVFFSWFINWDSDDTANPESGHFGLMNTILIFLAIAVAGWVFKIIASGFRKSKEQKE